jgi:hypothetical protein
MPNPMEDIIKSHPKFVFVHFLIFLSFVLTNACRLKGALVFGHQRDRPGVLVDPSPENFLDVTDERAVAEFRNTIWYAILTPMIGR